MDQLLKEAKMTGYHMTRTWSAVLRFDQRRTWAARAPQAVAESEYDLLADQTQAGLKAAQPHLQSGVEVVFLDIYKTTKARGQERDRTFTCYLNGRGRVVAH